MQRTGNDEAVRRLDRRVIEDDITFGKLLPSPIGGLDGERMVGRIFSSESDNLVGTVIGDGGADLKSEPP